MQNQSNSQKRTAKPPWLKVALPRGEKYNWIRKKSSALELSTVCQEARCPNIGECWQGGTATFMMMGDTCTRGCRFCSVDTAKNPAPLDIEEPRKLADTIANMDLSYVVLTSVDRDDLPDQGSRHLAACIRAIALKNPGLLIEMLMPDFCGNLEHTQTLINSKPNVLAHNLETVDRLTAKIRDPRAGYQQSLDVLHHIKKVAPQMFTKSSLMVGMGESRSEVIQAMQDLRDVGVDFLTIGQYLQPDAKRVEVFRYVHPDEFKEFEEIGESMGFEYVASGPLVRSSYRAAEYYIERKIKAAPKSA